MLYVYLRRGTRTRILVIAGDKLLVVKGWLGTDQWSLPGGGLHSHENPVHGALRELREETGIVVGPDQLQKLFKDTLTQHRLHVDYECFLLDLPGLVDIRRQRLELTDVCWFPMNELNVGNAGQDVLRAVEVWRDVL